MKARRQNDQSQPLGRTKVRTGKKTALAAHGAFAPLLGLWGALLGGLVVMVLPPHLLSVLAPFVPAGAAAPFQPMLAALAALVLGTIVFLPATMATRRARRQTDSAAVAKAAVRGLRPINPQQDLGSQSLDDPIETMPFAKPAVPEPAPEMSAPRALDLAQFAELPGRNAVWVEEQPESAAAPVTQDAPAPEPVAASAPVTELHAVPASPAPAPVPAPVPASVPHPGTAALARLRALPTSELSLPQMVERFAGALHEHRANPQARALSAAEIAAREAALAEALKALAALSGGKPAEAANDPLRAALAQLQAGRNGVRGAA